MGLKGKLAMSTWNYRVVRQTVGGEAQYGIHEMYYDPDGWTAEPVAPVADSVEELRDVLRKMAVAPEFDVIDDPNRLRDAGGDDPEPDIDPSTAAAPRAAADSVPRAPVEALLAAWEDLTAVATTLDERVAEVRRHLDAPAPDDENVYRDTTRDELETQLRECRQDHRDLYLDVERRTAERDAARSEVAALRDAGNALADAAANLIVECARRTVAHQAVHTRDLTGWPPLEREVKAWRSGR